MHDCISIAVRAACIFIFTASPCQVAQKGERGACFLHNFCTVPWFRFSDNLLQFEQHLGNTTNKPLEKSSCHILHSPNQGRKTPDKQTLTCFPAHLFFVESCLLPWCIALCLSGLHGLCCIERFSQSSWAPAHPSSDRHMFLLHFQRCPP